MMACSGQLEQAIFLVRQVNFPAGSGATGDSNPWGPLAAEMALTAGAIPPRSPRGTVRPWRFGILPVASPEEFAWRPGPSAIMTDRWFRDILAAHLGRAAAIGGGGSLKLEGLLTGTARAVAKRASRKRADLLLVDRGLAESREQAQTLIMEGLVFTPSGRVPKASSLFPETAFLEVRGRLPYVGRGGLKLAHALDFFAFAVRDLVALDIGASTGGFTDCLLQRGASRVHALDVGHGQLDYRLRADPRVAVMEKCNARHSFPLPEPVDLVTIDVSFISLALVIPAALEHLKDGRFLVVLVKPQFEARREEVGRGGVIKDPQVHAKVLGRTIAWAVGYGLRVRNLCSSPIVGDAGNREFFLLLQKRHTGATEKVL